MGYSDVKAGQVTSSQERPSKYIVNHNYDTRLSRARSLLVDPTVAAVGSTPVAGSQERLGTYARHNYDMRSRQGQILPATTSL